MSVNILLITCDEVGSALLKAATTTFGGQLPLPTRAVAVNCNADPAALIAELQQTISNMPNTKGLLILTDMFGSTPSNIAQALPINKRIRIVAGLNLPMLIRVMNYPKLSLSKLAEKALSGGREGILSCYSCQPKTTKSPRLPSLAITVRGG